MSKKTITLMVANPPVKDYPLPEREMRSLEKKIKKLNSQYKGNYPLGVDVERKSYGFDLKTEEGSLVIGHYFSVDISKEIIYPSDWLFTGGEDFVKNAEFHAKSIAYFFKKKTKKELKVTGF